MFQWVQLRCTHSTLICVAIVKHTTQDTLRRIVPTKYIQICKECLVNLLVLLRSVEIEVSTAYRMRCTHEPLWYATVVQY